MKVIEVERSVFTVYDEDRANYFLAFYVEDDSVKGMNHLPIYKVEERKEGYLVLVKANNFRELKFLKKHIRMNLRKKIKLFPRKIMRNVRTKMEMILSKIIK